MKIPRADWQAVSGKKDVYEYTYIITEDGLHSLYVESMDRSKNKMETTEVPIRLRLDNTAPVVSVSYRVDNPAQNQHRYDETVGTVTYYGAKPTLEITVYDPCFTLGGVTVAMNVKDANGHDVATSDSDTKLYTEYLTELLDNDSVWIESETDKHTARVPLEREGDYTFSISCKDELGNLAVYDDEKNTVYGTDYFTVDWTAPVRKVPARYADTYSTDYLKGVVSGDNVEISIDAMDEKSRLIYAGAAILNIDIAEANFYAEDVTVSVTRDGKVVGEGDGYTYSPGAAWNTDASDKNIHTLSLMLGASNENGRYDGDYQVTLTYTDRAGNTMDRYVSNIIAIDTAAPTISVVYNNNDAAHGVYYRAARKATITVTDRNIVPANIFVTVTAEDVKGGDVPAATHYRKGDSSKIQPTWTPAKTAYAGGSVSAWTTVIDYTVDAKYTFSIEAKDRMGLTANAQDSFVIDKTAPNVNDMEIVYSEALHTRTLNTVLRTITYGFYNPTKTNLEVTVSGIDNISGIEAFSCSYHKAAGSSEVNQEVTVVDLDNSRLRYAMDGSKATATFALPSMVNGQYAQYCGSFSVKAIDKAGNTSDTLRDDNKILVVDSIAPEWSVEYSAADRVVGTQDRRDIAKEQQKYKYSSAESENPEKDYIFYYKDEMTLTIVTREANFFAEDVNVYIKKDSYSPAKVNALNWQQNGDAWTAAIPIGGEGNYVVTMEYEDASGNVMKNYTSGLIVIDKTVPVIAVNYSGGKVVRQIDKIKYYDESLTATITITEHNFRPEDVKVKVTATDASGANIKTDNYAQYLTNGASWKREGDVSKAVVRYSKDANYVFEIGYADLSQNEAKKISDNFTVDKAAPVDLRVDYSTPVYETVLQAITFGFYNAQANVTMAATDGTSGVYQFEYSYRKSDGVSHVNAEESGVIIEESRISYNAKRKDATASFKIPSADLRGDNQFNGTVDFRVMDRSGKVADFVDNRRVVVDNISPVASVQFNEPSRQENGVSYYDGQIDVVITMVEANFYSEDVKVNIAQNGGAEQTISVVWEDESIDRHIGRFSLRDDGDYVMTVNYADRSSNQMETYQSEQLTIDTKKPVIEVRGVRNRSANRDDVIGFIVTAEDDNLNTSSLQPQLFAEIMDESGIIKMVDVTSKGNVRTITSKQKVEYIVENLEQDGIYNLTCMVADNSGNQENEFCVIESESQMMDTLRFSVNRDGSTYGLSEDTRQLVGTFAQRAGNVVVTEINPDTLSNISVTLFKDDKTLVLENGKDYDIEKRGGNGEWYEYIYTVYDRNFGDDGIYRMALHSEDAAGNVAENTLDIKNLEISFGIDKTAPRLMIANLESYRTYPVENLTVIMQADDNMKLVSVDVDLDGENYSSWNEEEIQERNISYEDYHFVITDESTKAHNVVVKLKDAAGNETTERIVDFYVTTNMWVRILNNKIFIVGMIIGFSAIVILLIVIVFHRRRALNNA